MKQQFLPYIFSAVLGLGLVSCDLDLTPENAITYSNAFATESELNTTTITIHFYLKMRCVLSRKWDFSLTNRNMTTNFAKATLAPSSRVPQTGKVSIA